MSPSRRPRPSLARSATTVVAAGLLPLALTACGASMDAQTYQERTNSDAANSAVGTLSLRGLAVLPPEGGDRILEEGSDADVVLVVTNSDDEPDELLEVTTDAAESVEVLVEDEPATLEVPPLGSTEDTALLRLEGLTEDLFEGETVTMTFRFQRAGTLEVEVPVATSGTTDRPVYTGEEGEEPALQAPAGGHGEGHGEEGDEPAEGQGEEGEGTGH